MTGCVHSVLACGGRGQLSSSLWGIITALRSLSGLLSGRWHRGTENSFKLGKLVPTGCDGSCLTRGLHDPD